MAEDVKSATQFIVRAWNASRDVTMVNTNNWHVCDRNKCNLVHLHTWVCLSCHEPHAMHSSECPNHPGGRVVEVSNVWGCNDTGHVHVCESRCSTCTTDSASNCTISGRPVMPNDILLGNRTSAPMTNRRCRRKRPSAHTNQQLACILMYDLLFSNRRQAYEESRMHIYNDITRRHGIKYARKCAKERKTLCLQHIVDIYVSHRERLRPVSHLFRYSQKRQQAICRKYATVIFNVWARFSSSMSRRVTFDAAAAALLYHMRRGLAFDGMHVVPMDAFLFNSLPGKLRDIRPFLFYAYSRAPPFQMPTRSKTSESAEEHSRTPKTPSQMRFGRPSTAAASQPKKLPTCLNSNLKAKQKIESFLRTWAGVHAE